MPTTIKDLIKNLSLPLLNVEAVRRAGNSYALNADEQICALSLSESELESLVLDESAALLEHIYLNNNVTLREICFMVPLPRLKHLYLSCCALTVLVLPAGCVALEQVYVQGNQLTSLNFEGDCPALIFVDASRNQLTTFILPAGFGRLTYLYLNDNYLQNLYFENALPALKTLHLRNNQLNEIPLFLIESEKMETLYLHANPMEVIDKTVLETGGRSNSWEGVRNYLLSFSDGASEYDQVKLIVLGNSTAGKSSIIYFLKDGTYDYNRVSTHGMVPVLWEIEEHFKVAVWDFGGQEYYHNIHHLFFTDKCLYMVIFEEKTNEQGHQLTEIEVYEQGEKVRKNENLEHFHYSYWLDNIRHLLQYEINGGYNPDYFLIQNKIELREKEAEKEADFRLSVKQAYMKNEDYTYAFEDFKRHLLKKLREIKGTVQVSKKWILVKQKIQEAAQNGRPWLHKTEYENLAEKIKKGISIIRENQKESELDTLTKMLERTGVILYYPELTAINDKIFINPEWITDTIYRVLDYNVQRENGQFKQRHIEESIREKHLNGKLIKAVELTAVEIIALMKGFDLIFEVNSEINKTDEPIYIAPQYLSVKCPEPGRIAEFKEDILQNAPPTFSLYYPGFMHKSVMPRFIARRGNLSRNPCWKYGISIVLETTKVLVECDFIQRVIHIWVEDKPKKPIICKMIFDDFQEINDKNPEIQISKNQKDWVRIGKLLRHDPENRRIEAENGERLFIEDFTTFLDSPIPTVTRLMKKVFISYSRKDATHLQELIKHLTVWKYNKLIDVWADQELIPGEKWDGKIKTELEKADIILFLVSADFLSTDYVWEVEMKRAIERNNDPNDNVSVVPIIVRNCVWEDSPLNVFNTAPSRALIISNHQNIDEAWTQTVKELKSIIFKT